MKKFHLTSWKVRKGHKVVSLTVRAQYSCDITKWASKGGYPSYPYFVSIPGLSKDSLSGTVGRGNLNTSW